MGWSVQNVARCLGYLCVFHGLTTVLMRENENYFEGGPKGTPQIGSIRFRTIKETNTQIAELLTGGLDRIQDVPKEQTLRMDESGDVTVENEKTLRISCMVFDVQGRSGQEFFKGNKVRHGFAHAINCDAIAENLVGPASEVIHSACHTDQVGCTQDVDTPRGRAGRSPPRPDRTP